MTGKEGDEFAETDDIYLAAYFMYAACTFVSKRNVGTKVYFRFQNPAGPIADLQKAFYSGAANVRAHDYAQKVVAAKQLLYV